MSTLNNNNTNRLQLEADKVIPIPRIELLRLGALVWEYFDTLQRYNETKHGKCKEDLDKIESRLKEFVKWQPLK